MTKNKPAPIALLKIYGKRLYEHRFLIGFFLLLFWIYWVNTFHTNFPDEFDNIVGGWYINQGKLPYTGFFSHHNPGAYYIASLITLFTRQSFVAFRMVWAAVLYLSAVGSYFLLRKKLAQINLTFHLGFMLLFGLFATYSWAHMILSETIVAYLLIPAYALIVVKILYGMRLRISDIVIISVTTSLALLTSFTFIFAVGILWSLVIYYFIKTNGLSRNLFLVSGIILLPYIVFGGYLFASGSLQEFYYDSIIYNRDFYIYNFPKVAGVVSKHPIRYAISIFYETSIQFHSLLVQVANFNFSYPLTITFLLSNLGLSVYFLTRKKYALSLFLYFFIVYLNARSEPLNAQETDFHSTVYFAISLFNSAFLFTELYGQIRETNQANKKYIYQILFAVVGIYAVFSTLFIARAFTEKTYGKFMGKAPGIYDAPVVAPIINQIVASHEYVWIGPFEFQELLYINGQMASKYHWFLPASSRSEKIKTEITADFQNHKPKLIVFKEGYSAFGMAPQDFNSTIVEILRNDYFRLIDLDKEGTSYKPVFTNLHNFDIAENFYFDKDRQQEIVSLLLEKNIIILSQ